MVRVMLVDNNIQYCPMKQYEGDAGFDVYPRIKEKLILWPKTWEKIPIGFHLEIPQGWVAIIHEKSGMAVNHGIMTIGNVIDSTYRGECHAILFNLNDRPYDILPGNKIAQMVIMPCYTDKSLQIASELSVTNRGQGGFGSTGK